jgi:outer membrane biosynthesis protein TonB
VKDKTFLIFIGASVVLHGALIIGLPSLASSKTKVPFQKIEVTYTPAIKEEKIKLEKIAKQTTHKKKIDFLDIPDKSPPKFPDYLAKLEPQKEFIKKPITYDKKPIIAQAKKVRLPEIKPDSTFDKANLPKNPTYLRYYQAIREKIRRYAYYNYNRAYTGEIYLCFVVASSGSLKALKIIEEKSAPNDYLKEIAVKSIKDAAPYPNIPKELDFPELSFNVIIDFELD